MTTGAGNACILKKLKPPIVTPCPRTSAPEGTVRIGFKIYQPSDK